MKGEIHKSQEIHISMTQNGDGVQIGVIAGDFNYTAPNAIKKPADAIKKPAEGGVACMKKEEILKMSNMILDQYTPLRTRMEYTSNKQKMMIASNNGLIKAVNVIIRNYSKSEEDTKEIVNSLKGRINLYECL